MNVIKVLVAEHTATVGSVPSSFDVISVKESDLITTKYIDRIKMESDGTITASLSNLIGDDRYLKLKPTLRE